MIKRWKRSLLAIGCSVGLAVAWGPVAADKPSTEECDPEGEQQCPPQICHNIGGPMELGANCDGATGACTYTLEDGTTLTVAKDYFLGIIIPPTSTGALAAHLAHGDGEVNLVFDPPLHLAYTGQNHQASNVECYARRAITTQPPEPGN